MNSPEEREQYPCGERLNSEWNPRYSAYAKAHGKAEDEMTIYDEAIYPGGCMTGFIIWISGKWREWKTLNKIPFNFPLGNEYHKAFDIWLSNHTYAPQA